MSGQAIADPECLKDCFDQIRDASDRNTSCLVSLIEDVTSKGTCEVENNPAAYLATQGINIWGWAKLDNDCMLNLTTIEGDVDINGDGLIGPDEMFPDYNITVLTKGTCSDTTEALFRTTACLNSLEEQPDIIKSTLELLVAYSCSEELYLSLPFSEFQFLRKRGHNKTRTTPRLAPVSQVNITSGTKTELNYENTRHRYPWICSLRTRGTSSEHLCAVNLLAVPPQPTVIVGSAHCTYLCKDLDKNGVTLPPCCCVTKGQESCQIDTVKCGIGPVAVEMDGTDAEIICGEWQTGTTSQNASGEEYNKVLPILEIVRSPAFDANNLGPGGGADIAVFKVDEASLQNSRRHRIFPACLPPRGRRSTPTSGVHSGWTKPPPLSFLQKFGSGFVPYYSDFFKQWHYSMDILERCMDPTVSQLFGLDIRFPSDTYYPPATVCAKDVTAQSCFSTGDSGSPLMVREEKRPQRFFIEGILSFVKGCELFTFGASTDDRTTFQLLQRSENPAIYTKLSCFLPWVAEQYGLSYEADHDETCSKGTGPAIPFNSTHLYNATCRENQGSDLNNIIHFQEYTCIFPFYYRGRGPYNECILFEEENFVYPVFRCPVRNITTKFPGTEINHFEESLELTDGYCIANCEPEQEDCDQLLDPERDDCNPLFRVKPFSTCKNDCPGGEYNPSSSTISILNACYCSEKFWNNWGWRRSFWSVCHCRSDYPGYSPGNR